MKKIQSFLIAKFQSSRLRESNYKINVTLSDLRRNNEIIRLSDNQILRTLRQILNKSFSQNELNDLIKQKRKLSKELSSKKELLEVVQKIDNILYVPEIISVHIENNSHYQKIIKNKLFVNSYPYVRMWAGAGSLRRNIINFIREDLKDKMVEILDNGRNKNIPLVPAKYSSYFSLSGSSSIPVSFPNICVVPDKIIERETFVNFVSGEGKETIVEAKNVPIKFNLFDGQGIMSKEYAEKISKELELDYNISWAICRGSWTKGLLVSFDFKKYNEENGSQQYVIDIYGDKIAIKDVDIFLSESQFKLYNCYDSTQEYVENCKKNNLLFGISRVSPSEKDEKKYVFSNYQFNQILENLEDEKTLNNFCKPTIDYIKDLSGFDQNKMLLYLLGENVKNIDKDYFYDSIQDMTTKALMVNRNVGKDPFIIQKFSNSLRRTKKESLMGKTLHFGNFSALISDVVAQMEHVLGKPVVGILNKKEYFSKFWSDRNIEKVVGLRAPLTNSSEGNVLNIKNNFMTEKWFSLIKSGIVISIYGEDVIRWSGSDFDGDLLMTTNQKEFIDGIKEDELPIYYSEQKAEKKIVTDELIYRSDLSSFNSSVGFVTNVSSSIFSMIKKYEKSSKEYKELFNRLIFLRREQGKIIDSCKGIIVSKFPEHWVKPEKIDYSLSNEERNAVEFNNKLVCRKRPLFFIHLYSSYNKRHLKELKKYDAYSRMKFKCSWENLLSKDNKSIEESSYIQEYYDKSFFSHEKSVMNNLMHFMSNSIKDIKNIKKEFDPNIYMNHIFEFNKNKYEKLKEIYLEYNIMKQEVRDKGFYDEDVTFDNFIECVEYLKRKCLEIGSLMELVDLAVKITYIDNKNANKNFLWDVFNEQIMDNLLLKSGNIVSVPYQDNNGNINYLWQNYSIKEISIDRIEKGINL